jgi:hypothetical protein
MSTFQLPCWVIGEEDPFVVEISKNTTVHGLKEAIRHKKEHAFKDFDTNDLILYKHTVEDDDNIKKSLAYTDITTLRKLQPHHTISRAFPDDPPLNHIFVVIVKPPGECKWLPSAPPALTKTSIIARLSFIYHVPVPCFDSS